MMRAATWEALAWTTGERSSLDVRAVGGPVCGHRMFASANPSDEGPTRPGRVLVHSAPDKGETHWLIVRRVTKMGARRPTLTLRAFRL